MVFKKHLTPLTKRGAITKNTGKGSVQERLPPGGMSSIGGGSPMNRMAQQYGKPAPPPQAAAIGQSSPLSPAPSVGLESEDEGED